MRELVTHLWHSNREEILARSRMNCHARGLHSIMLLESPGKTIRMFVTDPSHRMYTNYPVNFQMGMVLGFHAHHCELTLVGVKGCFTNWSVEQCSAEDAEAFEINGYLYRSPILNEGKGGFEDLGVRHLRTTNLTVINPGETIFMPAKEIHTVAVANDVAAWLVFEGREDKGYCAMTYSTKLLELENFDGMYQPVEEMWVEKTLQEVGLL